jgi:phospholipid transport system substrate-binding protein
MNNNTVWPITRRHIITCLGATVFVGILNPLPAKASETVAKFIRDLGDKAILQLADPAISDSEREERFRKLLNENFDVIRICRFVLGRYARKVGKNEMVEFRRLYEDIAVLTYAHLFASYGGEGFEVKREVGDPGDRYKMVLTEVQPSDGRPMVKLDWQVKVDNESYLVVDIRVEGASMAIAQREEYTSVLDRNGGDISDLLAQLRNKVKKLRADRGNG